MERINASRTAREHGPGSDILAQRYSEWTRLCKEAGATFVDSKGGVETSLPMQEWLGQGYADHLLATGSRNTRAEWDELSGECRAQLIYQARPRQKLDNDRSALKEIHATLAENIARPIETQWNFSKLSAVRSLPSIINGFLLLHS